MIDLYPMNDLKSSATDPVCGLTVNKATAMLAEHDNALFYFCGDHCRQTFLATIAGQTGPLSNATSGGWK